MCVVKTASAVHTPDLSLESQHFLFLYESLWGFYGFNHAQKDNNNQQNEM
jgi:hypothetical protein